MLRQTEAISENGNAEVIESHKVATHSYRYHANKKAIRDNSGVRLNDAWSMRFN